MSDIGNAVKERLVLSINVRPCAYVGAILYVELSFRSVTVPLTHALLITNNSISTASISNASQRLAQAVLQHTDNVDVTVVREELLDFLDPRITSSSCINHSCNKDNRCDLEERETHDDREEL